MSKDEYIFTSESVSEGHPDKVCDQISDTVLDLFLAEDKSSRVVRNYGDYKSRYLSRRSKRPSGVTNDIIAKKNSRKNSRYRLRTKWISLENVDISILLHEQSTDIAMGVDASGNKDEGASDQGIMFGYACRETDALMPLHSVLPSNIKKMADARRSKLIKGLGLTRKAK